MGGYLPKNMATMAAAFAALACRAEEGTAHTRQIAAFLDRNRTGSKLRRVRVSKYRPHQGKRECARRVRQAEKIAAKRAAQ